MDSATNWHRRENSHIPHVSLPSPWNLGGWTVPGSVFSSDAADPRQRTSQTRASAPWGGLGVGVGAAPPAAPLPSSPPHICLTRSDCWWRWPGNLWWPQKEAPWALQRAASASPIPEAGARPPWSRLDPLKQRPESVPGDSGPEGPLRLGQKPPDWRLLASVELLLHRSSTHPSSKYRLCAQALLLTPVPRSSVFPLLPTHILDRALGGIPLVRAGRWPRT